MKSEGIGFFVGNLDGGEFKLYSQMLRKWNEHRFYHFETNAFDLANFVTNNEKDGGKDHIVAKLMNKYPSYSNSMFIIKNDNIHKIDIKLGGTTMKTISNFFYSIKNPFLVYSEKETKKIREDMAPLFVFIYENHNENIDTLRDFYTEQAKKQKNNSNFACLSTSELSQKFIESILQEFEEDGKRPNFPLLVYFQPDFEIVQHKYHLLKEEISQDSIKKFMKDCIAGDNAPFIKIDSRSEYSFSSFEALNSDNWQDRLRNLDSDAIMILFQMPYTSSEMKKMPSELKNMLDGANEHKSDPNLEIFLFNSLTNRINNFIPDLSQPSIMIYLQGMKPEQAQIFQKKDISKEAVNNFIVKRSEFDKTKFDGMEGDMDFENMDLTKLMENLKDLDLGAMMEGMGGMGGEGMGGEGMGGDFDWGNMMEGMQDLMANMGGMGDMGGMAGMAGMANMFGDGEM